MGTLVRYPAAAFDSIHAHSSLRIEKLNLELVFDGRDQIANPYAVRQYYEYFRNLKKVISNAKSDVFIIDPYFNGEAFDADLSEVPGQISFRIWLTDTAMTLRITRKSIQSNSGIRLTCAGDQ
jgi:hypothetical protein